MLSMGVQKHMTHIQMGISNYVISSVGLVIGKCWYETININNGTYQRTYFGYQNCQSYIDIWWVCQGVRISAYSTIIIFLNHIDTMVVLHRYKDFCTIYRPKYYKNWEILPNTHTLLVAKKSESLIIDTWII